MHVYAVTSLYAIDSYIQFNFPSCWWHWLKHTIVSAPSGSSSHMYGSQIFVPWYSSTWCRDKIAQNKLISPFFYLQYWWQIRYLCSAFTNTIVKGSHCIVWEILKWKIFTTFFSIKINLCCPLLFSFFNISSNNVNLLRFSRLSSSSTVFHKSTFSST